MAKYTDKTQYDILKIAAQAVVYTLEDGSTKSLPVELDPANGKSLIVQTGEILSDSDIVSKYEEVPSPL
jgi:hypothetical protein